jgi:methyl-accepting chemotaxis protein
MTETTIDQGTTRAGPPESAVARARTLPRRRFVSDMPDKGLFALVAVVGFSSILGLKLYRVDSNIIAGFAVLAMVVYGAAAYRIPAVNLRLDRLGDNFYYLGFVYTLASMSAALIQLREGADLEALLGSFGIALLTTIVGVAGRVIFVQLRTEIDDIEAAIRRELLEASNDLKAQLSLSLREFETFRTGVRQAASEARMGAEEQINSISNVAAAAARRIRESFEVNGHHAEEMKDQVFELGKVVNHVGNNAANSGRELEQLLQRLEAVVAAIERRVGRRRWYWPLRRR